MIVFCDIDGTIADASPRFLKAGEEPKSRGKKWSQWLRVVQNKKTLMEDEPVPGMALMTVALAYSECTRLVYLTGRSEIYREVTEAWIEEYNFAPMLVLMRPKRNRMKNGKLKETLIRAHIKSYSFPIDEVVVIDDDQNGDIEKMCHKNGYTFLKARSGGLR